MAQTVTSQIALVGPKYVNNVASAVRAAACFGAERVWYTGQRFSLDSTKESRLPRELRMKAYAHVPLERCDRFFDRLDSSMVPVAVELLPGSETLSDFQHPESALYVFGPEDGDIPPVLRRHCHRFVTIPTVGGMCLNLAATVNVVLYDRKVKITK
jgi:tRNA(Leu) C34 or U34 (ribose-2'-O)-methylase TrmL